MSDERAATTSLIQVLRETVRDSSLFTLSSFLQRGLGLLLLPVYTRFLTPADYGYVEILMVSVTFANLLIGQGMATSLLRNLNYVYPEDRERRRASIGSAMIYVLASVTVFAGFVCVFAAPVSGALLDSSRLWHLVVVGAVLVMLSGVRSLFETLLFAEERMVPLAAGNFGLTGIKLVLNILFVVVLEWGYPGIVWSHLIGDLGHALALMWIVRDRLTLTFDFGEVRRLLGFGLPMVVMSLAMQVLFLMDRYFLGFLGFKEQLGIYAIANKFTDGFMFAVIKPFTTVWGAKGFRVARTTSGDSLFGQVANLMLLGGTAVAIGVVFLSEPLLRLLVAPPFVVAHSTLSVLIISMVLYGAGNVVKVTLAAQGKAVKISIVAIVAASTNLLFNALLIPGYGALGAAYATLASFAIFMAGYVILALREEILVMDWKTTSICGAALAILLLVRPALETWTLWERLLGASVSMGLFAIAVVVTNAEFVGLVRRLWSPSRPVSVKQ